MANKTVGLVGLWDCVAFDEVAGLLLKIKMQKIMKDYMASVFLRVGKKKRLQASMSFCRQYQSKCGCTIKPLIYLNHFRCYALLLLFLIVCIAMSRVGNLSTGQTFSQMNTDLSQTTFLNLCGNRKEQFSDISDKYFRFGSNLNQRDVIGVRK